jgi:hypothetical protein
LDDGVEKPPQNVVIFFADGMDVQRLHEMLDAGLLPNIRRVPRRRRRIRDAISSMPSVTRPNCSTILTGLYPPPRRPRQLLVRPRPTPRSNYVSFANAHDEPRRRQATLYDVLSTT